MPLIENVPSGAAKLQISNGNLTAQVTPSAED